MTRKNEYTSLQEFREEYDGISYKKHRSFIGIEFTYHDVYYRMCREPLCDEHLPTLPNGNKGHYPNRRKTPSFSYGDIRRVCRICVSN